MFEEMEALLEMFQSVIDDACTINCNDPNGLHPGSKTSGFLGIDPMSSVIWNGKFEIECFSLATVKVEIKSEESGHEDLDFSDHVELDDGDQEQDFKPESVTDLEKPSRAKTRKKRSKYALDYMPYFPVSEEDFEKMKAQWITFEFERLFYTALNSY